MSIGELLKEARKKAGVSLDEVEDATKIRRKYLKALEDEHFDVLPGKVYVRGFLRTYARYLNLDGEKIVEEFNQTYGDPTEVPEQNLIRESTGTKDHEPRKMKVSYIAAVAVVLFGLVYYLGMTGPGLQGKMADDGKRPGSIGDSLNNDRRGENGNKDLGVNPGDSAEIPNARGMDVELNVIGSECWMRIVVDNQDTFEGLVKPGSSKTFRGRDSVQLKLGNAGAVKVTVNGKDYGFLGDPGQVVTRAFENSNGEG